MVSILMLMYMLQKEFEMLSETCVSNYVHFLLRRLATLKYEPLRRYTCTSKFEMHLIDLLG